MTAFPHSQAYAERPDHTIAVTPHEGRVTVRFGGEVVAETDGALEMREASYPVVLYVPFADCRAELFEATEHTTHCPFKGDARYWTLRAGGETAENSVWGYDTPFEQVREIAGCVAFYPDRVAIEG